MADFGQLFPIRPGIQRLPITKSDAYLHRLQTAVARMVINSSIHSAIISIKFRNVIKLKYSAFKYSYF